MLSFETLGINAICMLDRRYMQAMTWLVTPPMHPWPFSQFPENDWGGDAPLELAKLPEQGYLNISHLPDARQ